MLKLKTVLLFTSALAIAQNGIAATVTWNLTDVTFSDGANATGAFDWNAASQTASNWNISVTAGVLSAFTYNPADSTLGAYLQADPQKEFLFMVNGSTRQLRLTPMAALTDDGTQVAINLNTQGGGSGSVECFNCTPYRVVTGGSFTNAAAASAAAATPEPASVGLFGLGFAGSLFLTRKGRRKVRTVPQAELQ